MLTKNCFALQFAFITLINNPLIISTRKSGINYKNENPVLIINFF